MKSALNCQILLPGMFREYAVAATCPPALRQLLRFSVLTESFQDDDIAWRCRMFGVERQHDFPVAPFAALADGLQPDANVWYCADPVHLRLYRDSLLISGVVRDQDIDQAQSLVQALSAHFSGQDMTFFAPHPDRWYVKLRQQPEMMTRPLAEVLGQSVQAALPQGRDALRWHSRLNEIQMLLHTHPVNLELEQQGRFPVNSVWFWGGGLLPETRGHPACSVWAHDAFTRGLALAHGGTATPLPFSAQEWLQMDPGVEGRLVVLDQLQQAAEQEEPGEWGRALEQLDRHWFQPLLEALRSGILANVQLHLAGERSVRSYTLTRSALFKFWRRAQPLEHYLG